MSVAPTVARARPRETMSEAGDTGSSGAAVRVEDIERALVVAREVATATAGGGVARLRVEHLRALFANGNGVVPPERMQAALEAAGLSVEPDLTDSPDAVSLRLDGRRATLAPRNGGKTKRSASVPAPAAALAAASAGAEQPVPRPTGVAAYQAATGGTRRPKAAPAEGVTVGDAQRIVAAEHAEQRTARSIAALMPALVVPVLAASFLGPLFGVSFAGLALLASALLSRPGALAGGKLGPLRMPASLARSFLLVSFGVALGALLTSVALIAAGGRDTEKSDPNAPLEQPAPSLGEPQSTTPPAPPADRKRQNAAERRERAARATRAKRRRERQVRERRARQRRERERARQREAAPPSGAAPGTTPAP